MLELKYISILMSLVILVFLYKKSKAIRLHLSRYVEKTGTALNKAAEQRELEGVVAKRKSSNYLMGKRSREWDKFKRMADEEFIVAGFIQKGTHYL